MKEIASFLKVRKWYVVLVILLIGATLAGPPLIYQLNLEYERSLDTKDLITRISECLNEKYDRWDGKAPYGYSGTAFARFEGMNKEEISDWASVNDFEISDFSSFSDGSIYPDFNIKDNLPASRICRFLNHPNITYHNPYLLGQRVDYVCSSTNIEIKEAKLSEGKIILTVQNTGERTLKGYQTVITYENKTDENPTPKTFGVITLAGEQDSLDLEPMYFDIEYIETRSAECQGAYDKITASEIEGVD